MRGRGHDGLQRDGAARAAGGAHSNRHTVAAAARFSDSARPRMRDADGAIGERRDLLGQSPGLVPEHERGRDGEVDLEQVLVRRPRPSRGSAGPGRAARLDRIGSRRPRTTAGGTASRPTRAPSSGCTTSTDSAVKTTPSAPAASAERRIVPALPGSRTARRIGDAAVGGQTRRAARRRTGDTPTSPCGVTVEVSLPITSSLTRGPRRRPCARGPPSGSRSSTWNRRSQAGRALERLADRLRALDQERAGPPRGTRASSGATAAATFAFLIGREHGSSPTPRSPEVHGSGVRQLAAAERRLRGLDERANAAGSFTARSARILRSSSTPAVFSPWMNREYDMPVLTGRGADARDPQPAELPLAVATVAVGVDAGVKELLLGDAVARERAPCTPWPSRGPRGASSSRGRIV